MYKYLTSLKQRFLSFFISKPYVKFTFIFTGIATTLWFLIRVIPKPQRAGYPCMQAAAPIMSGFVVYLLTLGGSVVLFKKAFSKFKQARYYSALAAFVCCVILLVIFNVKSARNIFSSPLSTHWEKGVLPDGANNPMGTGFGIFPGRVAWIRNPAATNENCKNVMSDAYFMAKNNNQSSINSMADKAILNIGGQATVKDSWDAIFKSFNKKKSGTETGYVAGQTIFIKINNGQAGWAINPSTLAETGNNSSTGVRNAAMANTTPATILAIVRQLVDSCNIAQENIYIGEPMTHVYKSVYDALHPYYPNVKLMDKENHTNLGRTKSSGWTTGVIKYSDKGTVMPDALSDALMNEMYNADYLINMAALKAHARAGVSLCAKLHFGSHGDHPGYGYGSFHLHNGLISTVDNDVLTDGLRGDYRMYRVLTDLMGHEKLGRNTVLFIVDGLWGGIEATDMAVKWKIAPFNNDWPSSLFVSQDEVAVESVCIDFLRAEADVNTAFKNRPFFPAVDDYLHQAASKANWPDGIVYDPEGDGTPMPASLGVHEHWNNVTDKKYSKNISNTGKGIELFAVVDTVTTGYEGGVAVKNMTLQNMAAYPNPCSTETFVTYSLKKSATVECYIISIEGRIVQTIKQAELNAGKQSLKLNTTGLSKGMYLVALKTTSNTSSSFASLRLIVK